MATLKDLSRHLSISVTQVSRALNGHSDVSEATRQRVLEAAKALNYHPNIVAQKLVSGRSGIVALVADGSTGIQRDTVFQETITGLSQAFSQRGMQFVLHIADSGGDIINVYAKLARSGAIDGFVVINPVADDPRIAYLEESNTPFVVHGRAADDPSYPFFDIDNFKVGYTLTKHLTGLGHRRIAFVNGEETLSFCQSRLAGYGAALTEAGEQLDQRLVAHGMMGEASGLVSAVRFFDENYPPPTAIICGNLLIAKGVFSALKALSLSVPHDISVVAHDDDPAEIQAAAFYPPLTVTRSPLSKSWGPLADFLSARIAGNNGPEHQVNLDPDFIIAQSCQAPQSALDMATNNF